MPLIELISEIAPRNYQNGNKFTILNTQYIEYAYNNTKTYDIGNVVLYNLGWYRCKVNGTVGVLPTVGANWDAIGGGGATLNNLGNVLFVSPTGDNTQDRATGIGQIDKPYTLAQAFAVCQDEDSIVVFNGVYNASYILGGSLTSISIYLMDAKITGDITFKNASAVTNFVVNIDGTKAAFIGNLYTEDNRIDLRVSNIQANQTYIDNILSTVTYENVINDGGTRFSSLATDGSLVSKGSLINNVIWQASNIVNFDIEGGILNSVTFFTGEISNLRIKNAECKTLYAIQFDNSVTEINIIESFRIVNLHQYNAVAARMVYLNSVTSWVGANKMKIIAGSTNGGIYDAQPSVASNIEYYNVAIY